MYNLRLTAEQLEFRDTLRDFVEREIKPAALDPERLQRFEKPLLAQQLAQAAQMGLRTLALSEAGGGAGADTLTCSIVLEELAAGDVDLAAVLGHTALVGHLLFDRMMNAEQRARLLPRFVDSDAFHLAFAGGAADALTGWCYHRALSEESSALAAQRQANGDWVLEGTLDFVPNAPLAALFVVEAQCAQAPIALLVPRDAPGLNVREAIAEGGERVRWHHGCAAAVTFDACRLPAANALSNDAGGFSREMGARARVLQAALGLGVARAAFEAAIDYTKLRRQGGRNIVEHQAIGAKLADMAVRLEAARALVWKAAWAVDHPEAVEERSLPDLPLALMARAHAAEAAHAVTLEAAECFGAMGVMRDMPLQKYVHDALVLLHAADNDSAATLPIAEAIAGYRRPIAE